MIRCVLASAAAGMMFEAFKKRQNAFGAVFAGLALLYNPVVPVFGFSGNGQLAARARRRERHSVYSITRLARSEGGPH